MIPVGRISTVARDRPPPSAGKRDTRGATFGMWDNNDHSRRVGASWGVSHNGRTPRRSANLDFSRKMRAGHSSRS